MSSVSRRLRWGGEKNAFHPPLSLFHLARAAKGEERRYQASSSPAGLAVLRLLGMRGKRESGDSSLNAAEKRERRWAAHPLVFLSAEGKEEKKQGSWASIIVGLLPLARDW